LERLPEVEALIRRNGLVSARLSQAVSEPWDVGVVDTFGQLPHYYGLADVAFVGGSLIPHGGQNPLEPASLGKPVIFGPSMQNFADIAHQLLTYQAAQQLLTSAELTQVLHELLTDRRQAMAMGRRAQELVEKSRGTARRTLELLNPLLST
jgi:3-deoxy-D-manno-octulosonic-acid transferase